ncbi:MAG TPA: type II CAAX endopeptidase family protein [Vineibacter sp.]|nr:type II CAAX endopeptidase family protein [Vineibacter sp.]
MLRTDLTRDNSLIADVRHAKLITPWWLAIPIGGGLLILVTAVLAPLAAIPLGVASKAVAPSVHAAYFSSILTILAFGFTALVLLLWVRLVERRPFHTIGFRPRHALLGVALGVGTALLFTTLVMGGLHLLGMLGPAPGNAGPIGLAALQGIMIAALTYAVQASTEEMIYRGWLQNVIAVRIGAPIAIVIATIAFTAAHSRNTGFGLLPCVNLVLFAAFLALLSLRTGGLWASCAWHATWNWSLNNIWGVPLSGLEPEGGSAMAFSLTGPALFTGGAWGPEGGLLATAVLVGATVWAGLWRGLGDRAAPSPAVAHGHAPAYRAAPPR